LRVSIQGLAGVRCAAGTPLGGSRRRLSSSLAVCALLFSTFLFTVGGIAEAATAERADIGMPFSGKWAYNVNVDPPYTDVNSSHPTVHHIPAGGDWATDIYGTSGQAARLLVSNATGNVTFSWRAASTTCGTATAVNVFVDGQQVGWIHIVHLVGAVKSGPITNGMTLGTVGDFPDCAPGRHLHVEMKSDAGNFACWQDYGRPGSSVVEGGKLGGLGATGATGGRQSCSGDNTNPDIPSPPANISYLQAMGRVGLTWTASPGAVAYDVYRGSVYLGATSGVTFYDRGISAGQTYTFAIYARNGTGGRSSAGTVQVLTSAAKAPDRSWVSFKTGPALCGRVGDTTSPRIGCTVQTSTGWRFIGLPRNTDWGYEDARAWVPAPGGAISYCRTVGGPGNYRVMCTKLNPVTMSWGPDVSSLATDLTYSDPIA
jgi:hypothetical protein